MTDERDGYDINYLISNYGLVFDVPKVTIFNNLVKIGSENESLQNEFEVQDLYSRCSSLTFQP